MMTKIKELCEQSWCSQMVANCLNTHGDSVTWCLKEHYTQIVDWTQTWRITPQGGEYWSLINNAWIENHRQR